MPLLTAPFPNNDPLGIAHLARAGIGDFQRNLAMGTELAQRNAEVQMKMQAQMLGDIQDSLWKKREVERREAADAFNMQVELRKLDMLEKENQRKLDTMYDKWDETKNPLYGEQVRGARLLADKREQDILTPEQLTAEAKAKAMEQRQKELELARLEREGRFETATTTEAQASEFLANSPDLSGVKIPSWLPGGGAVSPLLEGYNAQRGEVQAAQQQAASEKKFFAPIPKPGTIPAPRPERPPTIGESLTIADRSIRPLEAKVDGIRKQVDEAKKNKAAIASQKKAILASGMTMTTENKTRLAELEALEKEADKFEARDIDDRPVTLSLSKAEEFLSQQAQEAARRKAKAEQDALSLRKTSASSQVAVPLPLPGGDTTRSDVQIQSPMLPTLDSIGLDGPQKDLLSKMLFPVKKP